MSTGSKREANDGDDGSDDHARAEIAAMRRTLRTERRRVVDEREAFRAFRKRLTDIDAGGTLKRPASPSRLVGTSTVRSTSPGLVAVRNAYEETVMSVPHYVVDYDDTYPESLAAEFGAEMATALTRGVALDPRLKRELRRATERLRAHRASFLDTLDTEAASLEDLADPLLEVTTEIETIAAADFDGMDFGALDAYCARTETLRDRCAEHARERQAVLHRQRRELRVPGDSRDVPRYLYREQSARYPILSMLADRIDRLDELRSTVERAIARY